MSRNPDDNSAFPARKKHFYYFVGFAVLFLIGYLLLVVFTDIRIQCPFKSITGLQCPGCGMTRMIIAMLHGNFAAALRANPLAFATLPLLAAYAGINIFSFFKKQRWNAEPWMSVTNRVIAVVLAAYGLLRNLI